MQGKWNIQDTSTWASLEAEALCGDDERMIAASAPLTAIWQAPDQSRPGSASDGGGDSGGAPLQEFAPAPGRPSVTCLRPATPAEESVKAFLTDPEILARMEVGDGASTSGDSGDDEDIPDVLRVQPSQAGWPGVSHSGSLVSSAAPWSLQGAARPQTCRGLRRNRVDGAVMSPRSGGAGWGGPDGGKGGLRPQTAHSGARVLSAREKLDRRKGYKAPTPPADEGHVFSSPAKPRFRM